MTALVMPRRTRGVQTGLAVSVALMLIAGAASAYVLSTRTSPVTVSQAISRFRAATGGHAPSAGTAASLASPAALSPAGVPASASASSASGATGPGGRAAVGQTVSTPGGGPAAVTVGPGSGPAVNRTAGPVAVGTGAPTPSAPPGVYSYATTGSEQVSALGGSQHTYPSHTTMTVTTTACGTDVRWDGLQQRYDQWELCAAGQGLALRTSTTFHDFFNQVDKRVYTCTAATRFRPDSTTAGTTFGGTCTANGAAAILRGTVVGIEQVPVGTASVAALHVHLDEQLTGGTAGTRTGDSWYALSDNLLVRRTSATEADTQTSFGATHYHERLQLALTDLRPAT